MSGNNKLTLNTNGFTVDQPTNTTLAEMPSITRLLNRKKLATSQTKQTLAVSSSPPPSSTLPLTSEEGTKPVQMNQVTMSRSIPPVFTHHKPSSFTKGPSAPTEVSLMRIETNAGEIVLNPPEIPEEEQEGAVLTPDEKIEFNSPSYSEPQEAPLELGLTLTPEPAEAPVDRFAEPSAGKSVPFIKPMIAAHRRAQQTELHIWSAETLKKSVDPLAKGIAILLSNGASSTLFLSLSPGSKGASTPLFAASAISGDRGREALWKGLIWDPVVVPAAWNYFIRVGHVELSPPGTLTDQMSQRNVLRSAFGVQKGEWLLLAQIGPEHACRGALAILSKKSIIPSLAQAIGFFKQVPPKAAA